MIVFPCSCGKRLRAPDRAAGRSMPCPFCRRRLTVPVPKAPRRLWPWLAGAGGLLVLAGAVLVVVLVAGQIGAPPPRADKDPTSEPSGSLAQAPARAPPRREPEKRPPVVAPVRPDPKPEKPRPPAPRSEPAAKPPLAVVPVKPPAVSALPAPEQSPGIASSSPSTSPLPPGGPPAAPVPAGLEQPRRLRRLVIWKPEGLGLGPGAMETATYLSGTAFSSDRRTLAATYSVYAMSVPPSMAQEGHRDLARPNQVTLWDLAAGTELRRLRPASPIDFPRGPAFSSDGTRLLTVSGRHLGSNLANGFEASVRLWDARTGKELASQSSGKQERVFGGDGAKVMNASMRLGGVAFSPDGRSIAYARDDADLATAGWADRSLGLQGAIMAGYCVFVWDARLKREVRRLVGHTAPVHALAFSPDGKYLFSASGWGDPLAQAKAQTIPDESVRQWSLATGREVRRFAVGEGLLRPGGDVHVLHRPGGDVGVLEDNKVRRAAAGEGFIRCLAVSPDGRRLLTGGGDRRVRCWDVASGKQRHDFGGRSFEAVNLAFSPDGRLALLCGTASPERTPWPQPRIDNVLLCDVESGAELVVLRKCQRYCTEPRYFHHSYSITNAAFSPDGRRAFLVVQDKEPNAAIHDKEPHEVVVEEWGLPAALGKAGRDGKRDPGGLGGAGGSSRH